MLAPKPLEFEPVPVQRVDDVDKVQTSLLKSRGRRWFGAGWSETPRRTLRQIIDDEASFNLRPYTLLWGSYPILCSPDAAVRRRCDQGPLSRSCSRTWWPCWRRLPYSRGRRARTSWWPTTPIGLFDNSGSTMEPWSRRGMFALVSGKRRPSTLGQVEMICWSVLQFSGPAWSDERSDREEVYSTGEVHRDFQGVCQP